MVQDNNRITLRESRSKTFIFYSTNPFFVVGEYYVFESDDYGFSFRIPNIDEEGNCKSIKANKNGCTLTINEVFVPMGYYQLDQGESTEDEIRVYYGD